MRFVKYLTLLCCLFFAGGTIKAQETHWNFDAYAFEYDMTAYLTVEYDGNLVGDLSDYEVAAFVDDECRGVSRWVNTEAGYPYLYMRIRSNQEQGESVKFKVYQKSKNKEIECDETISFENRSVIGLPSSPHCVKLKVDTFTVTVETLGKGTVTGAGIHKEGVSITLTATPAEGWRFEKWSDGTTSPTYTMTVNSDQVLTAEFVRNSYVVGFVVDGTTISEQTLEYEARIEIPSVPEKEGYTFSGFGEVDETVPAHDVTYTAVYNVNSYKLTYFLNGELFAEDSITYDSVIIPREVPNSDKEQFSGWEGLPEVMPAHDVVVYGSTTTTGFHIVGKNKQLVTVYSVNGTIIKRNVDMSCLEKLLSPGLYIISGKKVLIK